LPLWLLLTNRIQTNLSGLTREDLLAFSYLRKISDCSNPILTSRKSYSCFQSNTMSREWKIFILRFCTSLLEFCAIFCHQWFRSHKKYFQLICFSFLLS
jgi:hypothetical protein